MKKTRLIMVFLIGMLMFNSVFAFFGGKKKTKSSAIKVALILPSTIDDMAWSQAMYEGAKSIEEKLGADKCVLKVSERLGNPIDAGVAIREYAFKGYDIIIAHGAQYESVIREISQDFPEITFAYAGYSAKADNIFGYDTDAQEGAYLLGMIAGLTTKTNIIGIVGPVAAGEAIKYNSGFIQGVKSVNAKADIRIAYTGSFGDVVAAGEVARTHIKAGADILTGSAQQSVGAIKVVSQYEGTYWFGTDLDQSPLAPKSILACQLYLFEDLIDELITKRSNGILGGEGLHLTFANNQLDLIFNDKIKSIIDSSIIEKVKTVRADITSGKMVIPVKN